MKSHRERRNKRFQWLIPQKTIFLVTGFALLLVLWVLSWAETIAGGALGQVLAGISMLSHLDQLLKGLFHLADAVYFVTFVGVFLFATTQRVEAYRWR